MSWMSIHLDVFLCSAGLTGAAGRRNNKEILVKSMEWQEGNDTTGISSAVNKEKLHFLINDILRKENRQERQRKGHVSACLFLSFQKSLLHLKMWHRRERTVLYSAYYPTCPLFCCLQHWDGLAPGMHPHL